MIRAFFDNLSLAFGTFVAHPLRTMLTLLGIVIGTSTVMSMMALLEGLRVKVNKDFSQLGANVFRVDKWPQGFRFGGFLRFKAQTIFFYSAYLFLRVLVCAHFLLYQIARRDKFF
jgi:ABC-type antimicrobial peptide transport system permease subunit